MSAVGARFRSRMRRSYRSVLYSGAALLLVAFGVVRARGVREGVAKVMLQSIEVSLPVTGLDVAAWARGNQAQASLLARVADQELPSIRVADRARYSSILRSLDTGDGYAAGWLFDADRGLLATAGDTTEPPSMSSATGMSLARSGARTFIDFVAVAGRARVVLRSTVASPAFPNLNPVPKVNRTGRTSLLYRRGDSLLVAATRSNDSTMFPSSFPVSSAVRPIADAAAGRPAAGIAAGVSGHIVAYAVVPLASPGWTLLRSEEVDEVIGRLWQAFAKEIALVATVILLLAALVDYWIRAARLRRDHELTQVRADFVASVSHELRTPLAQIRMYAELLRKGSMRTPQDTQKALNVIEKEAHRLNILVDNVLNFTRLRRRTARVPSIATRVDDDITHVVQAFTPLARERSVSIETQCEPGLTAAVDSLALRQIVLNFLENAVKYGPIGQTVTVRAQSIDDRARISVEDRGPGVSENERDAVWQPFVRGSAATAGNSTGSGIGLAVVRDLVLQHAGTYSIERAELGGARFVVEFPRFPR